MSREVYRQGIGGMWIQSLVLFLTPFYWFSTMFFRRVRLTTIGDFYAERFEQPVPRRRLRRLHARALGLHRRRHRHARRGQDDGGDDAEGHRAVHAGRAREHRGVPGVPAARRRPAARASPPAQEARWDVLQAQAAARRTALLRLARQPGLVLPDLRARRRRLHDDGRLPGGGHHRRHPGGADHHLLGDPRPGRPGEAGRVRGAARRRAGPHVRAVRIGVAQRLRLVHRRSRWCWRTSCPSSPSCRACRRPGRRRTNSPRASA
ncbi:MAG: hypothetical protein MZV64_42960 [Ignavibacteriales bacterium]|nr:hypothetical protein [Ignavibacteriales bacterium]